MPVATPATVAEVASVLRDTAGQTVLVRGAGTKLHWGSWVGSGGREGHWGSGVEDGGREGHWGPVDCDLTVDLHRLDRILDHAAGDMVVQVEAGAPLATLAAAVADAGQQLALDVPAYDDGTRLDTGTVGGALAVGLGGPRRLRYGRLRDLLLGVTMVRADGVVASSGGRVVKNVAGYDLGKLLCGSYGTLGVLVTATLRLHPLPAATGWVSTATKDPLACAAALLDSQLVPSAVELDRPDPAGAVAVAALFEGTGDGVAARVAAAADLIDGEVVAGSPEWFGRWPGGPDGTLVRVTCPPARLGDALTAVDAAATAADLPVQVRGSPGLAELQLGLPADPSLDSLAAFLSTLRPRLAAQQGSAVVIHGPASEDLGNLDRREPAQSSAIIDPWGPVDPGALALMRRVKDQFDPGHRLAPGRFVGGI